ncbi:DUF4426 domain-containing protein [Pseudomonas sp. N040]|uniref:DUF4426 domain-containing protein n=1 Tax=Pseudomonas sp. N040 TaxID=2785325 RepID=UPI0018A25978|nr:DUF4426 domain-containing protein [Pseudomonas sp. N040]MBF7729942.1 DUF4426 domain-containing protein [Pseudomonas sp. N040]MBW7013584.1 DUF4426 domain-containing protein [Pseudomonas sp. N040]
MRQLMICLLTLCLSLPAFAERKQTFGEIDVHYSVFNSSFLQPNTAAASGLVRSKTLGVVSVSVLKDGKPLAAKVEGSVQNLLGQQTVLTFKQVDEPGASYHLAQFALEDREVLTFSLNVNSSDGGSNNFTFSQEVFPDE